MKKAPIFTLQVPIHAAVIDDAFETISDILTDEVADFDLPREAFEAKTELQMYLKKAISDEIEDYASTYMDLETVIYSNAVIRLFENELKAAKLEHKERLKLEAAKEAERLKQEKEELKKQGRLIGVPATSVTKALAILEAAGIKVNLLAT